MQQMVEIAGIRVIASEPSEATKAIIENAKKGKSSSYHFINAYTVSLAANNDQLKSALNDATAVFPDGKPLTWVSRLKGIPARQIKGPTTFENVLSHGRKCDLKHFLLGSTEATLSMLKASILREYPGVNIVGTYSPPFRPLNDDDLSEQDQAILESGAEIVWVGLGTPKQDYETHRLAANLDLAVAAVGAAFDFTAGTKKEAPSWISAIGFEWLFRFVTEPKRLWKRYTIGNTKFLWHTIRSWKSDAAN